MAEQLSQTALSGLLLQAVQSSSHSEQSDEQIRATLRSTPVRALYTCFKESVWPAISTTIEMSSPQDKTKACHLLEQLLSRLIVSTSETEGPVTDWFELDFAKEVFTMLVAKVRDMYCCTASVEILHQVFVTGSIGTQPLATL